MRVIRDIEHGNRWVPTRFGGLMGGWVRGVMRGVGWGGCVIADDIFPKTGTNMWSSTVPTTLPLLLCTVLGIVCNFLLCNLAKNCFILSKQQFLFIIV